jgi:hypothetical protein
MPNHSSSQAKRSDKLTVVRRKVRLKGGIGNSFESVPRRVNFMANKLTPTRAEIYE